MLSVPTGRVVKDPVVVKVAIPLLFNVAVPRELGAPVTWKVTCPTAVVGDATVAVRVTL